MYYLKMLFKRYLGEVSELYLAVIEFGNINVKISLKLKIYKANDIGYFEVLVYYLVCLMWSIILFV